MPVHRAAYKSLRSDAKKRARNEVVISELKTRSKTLENLINQKKKDEALSYLTSFTARYMRAASKGIIHKKTASRKISRMSKRIAAL